MPTLEPATVYCVDVHFAGHVRPFISHFQLDLRSQPFRTVLDLTAAVRVKDFRKEPKKFGELASSGVFFLENHHGGIFLLKNYILVSCSGLIPSGSCLCFYLKVDLKVRTGARTKEISAVSGWHLATLSNRRSSLLGFSSSYLAVKSFATKALLLLQSCRPLCNSLFSALQFDNFR